MIYSFQSLERMAIDNSFPDTWGSDVAIVKQKVQEIIQASCSPCMYRRKINSIEQIIRKYGDHVQGQYQEQINISTTQESSVQESSSSSVIITEDNRLECLDCTYKHLAQAYILQGEFYSGYTEYLNMIIAHMREAIQECPKENRDLYSKIGYMYSSCLTGLPNIAISYVLDGEFEKDEENLEKVLIEQPFLKKDNLYSDLYIFPDEIYQKLIKIIEKAIFYSYSDKSRENSFNWAGYLAWAAELCSNYSKTLTTWFRKKRLCGISLENAKNNDKEVQSLGDLLDILKSLKNTQKSA